jgi:hypothetical protein
LPSRPQPTRPAKKWPDRRLALAPLGGEPMRLRSFRAEGGAAGSNWKLTADTVSPHAGSTVHGKAAAAAIRRWSAAAQGADSQPAFGLRANVCRHTTSAKRNSPRDQENYMFFFSVWAFRRLGDEKKCDEFHPPLGGRRFTGILTFSGSWNWSFTPPCLLPVA